MRETELSKEAEAKAICELLGIDCRGRREVESRVHLRAETMADLLRWFVRKELKSRRA